MAAFRTGAVTVVFEGCFIFIIGVCGTGLLGEVTATVCVTTGPFGTVTNHTGLGGVFN